MSAGFYSSSKSVPSRSSIIGPVTPFGRWQERFPSDCGMSNSLDLQSICFGFLNSDFWFLTFVWLPWQASVIITWLYEVVMKPLGLGNVSPAQSKGLAHNFQYLRQEIALGILKIKISSNLFSISWFSFVFGFFIAFELCLRLTMGSARFMRVRDRVWI